VPKATALEHATFPVEAIAYAAAAPAPAPPPAVEWCRLPYGEERGRAFASARRAEGACPTCAGSGWWRGEGEQASPRCGTCHPPPPGLRIASAAAPDPCLDAARAIIAGVMGAQHDGE
jgi:hypothetical protein